MFRVAWTKQMLFVFYFIIYFNFFFVFSVFKIFVIKSFTAFFKNFCNFFFFYFTSYIYFQALSKFHYWSLHFTNFFPVFPFIYFDYNLFILVSWNHLFIMSITIHYNLTMIVSVFMNALTIAVNKKRKTNIKKIYIPFAT